MTMDRGGVTLPSDAQAPPVSENNGTAEADPAADAEVDLSMFDLSKKKKKKKKKPKTQADEDDMGADGDDREEGEGRYNYETLLERIQVCCLLLIELPPVVYDHVRGAKAMALGTLLRRALTLYSRLFFDRESSEVELRYISRY